MNDRVPSGIGTGSISVGKRRAIYVIGNIVFAVTVLLAATLQNATGGSPLYLVALFALCTVPVLVLDRFNGRYLLLGILLFFYFLFFGMLDLITVLLGGQADAVAGPDASGTAEWGILSGAVCILVGYLCSARSVRAVQGTHAGADWPESAVFFLGLLLWVIGVVSMVYFAVYVVPEKTIAAAGRGFAMMGPVLTFIVMLGHLVAPLGLLILAYGYARYRSMLWFVTMLGVTFVMILVAFVTDIRGYAVIAPAMIMVALTLTDNKVPRMWILGTAVMIAVIFPVLTAYRIEITGERGLTREQAVHNLDKVIEAVLAYRERLTEGRRVAGSQTVFERLSLKGNVELAFEHTGVDRPFQNGATLVAVPLAFIPRLIWPDKPDVPTGQLFNHEFVRGGSADTYISPSHLGELYWNFGWPGLLVGLTFIGALLGLVAAKCCMAEHASVTRLLVLLVTVYYLCMGFEGAMSVSYILWLRSLAFIGILHVLLARSRAPGPVAPVRGDQPLSDPDPPRGSLARFPNIMT
jgi:hypothetical protein